MRQQHLGGTFAFWEKPIMMAGMDPEPESHALASTCPAHPTALQAGLDAFSRTVSTPLRDYQRECAHAVLRSVERRAGHIITVMFARQMGKNELSAQLEAYLLLRYADLGGTIVKAAPSFRPQITNSMDRLQRTLQHNPTTFGLLKPAYGHVYRLGRAAIAFYSAAPHANVVGATAGLLLEIDEAQDVDPDKYDRDFRPMASSTNATTVLYGTAWNEDSLLHRQIAVNRRRERDQGGPRLHFEFDWTVLAAQSPVYKEFVEAEIARLGPDHPSIQTQYRLQCLSDAGRLFTAAHRAALRGTHPRQRRRTPGALYVAGIDIAGAAEQAPEGIIASSPDRDSTVVTIAEVIPGGSGDAVLQVVEHVRWTGANQVWQFERMLRLWEHWQFARVVVDASGIGSGLAAFLAANYGPRVEQFLFTAPAKSRLAYTMLAMVNTGRLRLYRHDGSDESRTCWEEIQATRYELRGHEQMAWEVPPAEGHDDFVVSLALCCRAAQESGPPPVSGLYRARRDAEGEW